MSNYKYLSFLIFLLTIGFSQTSADNELIVVNTIDYRSYTGIVDYESADSLYFNTFDGKSLEFPKSNILMTYNYNGRVKNGRLQRLDPNSSFYLFSPSAFSINNGNLYCRDFCLFYPSVNYGIANIISLQDGTEPLRMNDLGKFPNSFPKISGILN